MFRITLNIYPMNTAELYEYGETALAEAVPKANAIKKELVCPIHKRKVLFKYDYSDSGTHAYITRYCCLEHAQRVAKAFEEAQLFDHVSVENQ